MPFIDNALGTGTAPAAAEALVGGYATVVATGSSATDAFQLSASFNLITTSSGSTGVKLPTKFGGWLFLANRSGQTITIYPPTGFTVDTGASITLANTKKIKICMVSGTAYESLLGA